MNNLLNDLRFALRTLRRQKAFTVTVLLTLGLAIGASTAIFSVVESTLLRPLPFREPARLSFLWGVAGPKRAIRGGSFIEVKDWIRLNRAFESVAIYDETSLNLRTAQGADRIQAEMVSASFFPMLGVGAQAGRVFTATEDSVPDANPVVVISDNMWTTRFNRDPSVIGRTLTLNDRPFTVLGVMPRDFRGISFDTDLWFPAAMVHADGGPADLSSRGSRWLGAIGRMKPGVSTEVAQADADRVAAQLAKDFPESNKDRGIQLLPLRDSYLGSTRAVVLAVFAGVGLLLLIACANVIGLQLVRATSRHREFALRFALGAQGQRLVQQLVVEGLVLAAAAAVIGLFVASIGLSALLAIVPTGLLPSYATPTINVFAFAFAAVIALGCGVAFGVAPAMRSARINLTDALKQGSRGSASGFGRRLRLGSQQLLVVAEAATALVLLIGAGLYVRSLNKELGVSLAFDPHGVLHGRFAFPDNYDAAARVRFVDQLQARVAAIPSVRDVSASSDVPLASGTSAAFLYVPDADQSARFYRHSVTPNYFKTLRIPLVSGRTFTSDDRAGMPNVVVVNASMAKRFWPGQSAVGKTIRLGDTDGPEATVVGIVGDVRQRDLTTPLATTEPDVYFAFAQRSSDAVQLAVRSDVAAESITASVRRELAAMDQRIPLYDVQSLETLFSQQTASGRFGSTLLVVFGAAALVLTAVGLYGALAFVVSLRRRELGIRLALGATQRTVLREVVGHGVRLAVIGVAGGIVAALLLTRWISSQLYGVSANDPVVFTVAPLVLVAIAIAASWVPARRAAQVDPQTALRSE